MTWITVEKAILRPKSSLKTNITGDRTHRVENHKFEYPESATYIEE